MRYLVCFVLALLGCKSDLDLFDATDPRCVETYCEALGRTCGVVVDPCGVMRDCGACEGSTQCTRTGTCAERVCPISPGEVVELGRYSGFLPRPTAFATTPTHVFFWTAFPRLSTPGSSRVFRADKCGGELLEVHEPVGQDNRDSGYTIDVDDTHVYFANQRPTNFPVYRALQTGGEREALTAGQTGVCGLVVDEPRDRVLFARCRESPGIYSVPRTGGDVTLCLEGTPLRRVVREDDRLAWIDQDPPGLRMADLGTDTLVATVVEPATPQDVVLHFGAMYWLRPIEGATELVTLTVDGPAVLARLGANVRSLAAFGELLYVVEAEGPLAVDIETGDIRRLAGQGGEHVFADWDGLYVTGTETVGDGTQHVVRRYGL